MRRSYVISCVSCVVVVVVECYCFLITIIVGRTGTFTCFFYFLHLYNHQYFLGNIVNSIISSCWQLQNHHYFLGNTYSRQILPFVVVSFPREYWQFCDVNDLKIIFLNTSRARASEIWHWWFVLVWMVTCICMNILTSHWKMCIWRSVVNCLAMWWSCVIS